MVDSSPPHNLTLLPPHTTSSHRRRPLRSRTYTAFIQLISHCSTNSPPLKLQEPVREVEGSITQNKANPADVLCPHSIREGYKNTIVQEDSNKENKNDNGFQDGGFNGMQEPIAELNHAKLVADGKQDPIAELNHAKLVTDGKQEPIAGLNHAKFVTDGKQKPIAELDHANLVTDGEQETIAELRHAELVMDGKKETIAELHHSNFVRDGKQETISEVHQAKLVTDGKQETIAELHHAKLVTDDELEVSQSNSIIVEDFLVAENLMADCTINNSNEQENLNGVLDIQMDDFGVDKDFCIDQFNDVFESCFGMDIESSKGRESQGNDSVLEGMSKDAEQELQLKEMELEKLIHHSGGVESSFRPNTDIEMEEGEISGEAGKSLDASSDDAASLEKRTTENMHASEHYCDDGELFCPDEDKGDPQHESFDQCVVNSGRNSPKMARKTSAGQMQDNHMETQRTGAIIPKVTPRGRIHQVNAAENQDPFTTGKKTTFRICWS